MRNLGRTLLGSIGSFSAEVAVRPRWPEQIKGLTGHRSLCGSSSGLGGAFSLCAGPRAGSRPAQAQVSKASVLRETSGR